MSQSGAVRSRERGYTIVELMMALAIFGISVIGIITIQKVSVTSNAHAKNLAMAQRVAAAWASQLEMDGSAWRNTFAAGFLDANGVWERPAYIANRKFGAAFDALGNPLTDSDDDLKRARFCSHVRMSWLFPNGVDRAGNAVIRAEIRVFWLRDGASPWNNGAFCGAPGAQTPDVVAQIGQSTDRYHFVYETVAVRQHLPIVN
jgi:prepilin-type N-terminal cleavage/methylation domain-containing protein